MFYGFDQKAEQAIPAEVRMISGCADSQTSADVSNVGNFQLPNPQGRSGGACTAGLLQVLYAEKNNPTLSWVDVLRQLRTNLLNKGAYGLCLDSLNVSFFRSFIITIHEIFLIMLHVFFPLLRL